jgi:hypothetical protein
MSFGVGQMPGNAQLAESLFYESAASSAEPATPKAAAYPNFYGAFNAPPERKWQIEVQNRLLKYVKMQKGWDSYGAPPVGWDTGMFALSVLNDVMRTRTPIPQVVPSAAGGVQLEWHQKGIDLELHIAAPYQCELWFQDHQQPNDPPVSVELTDNFSALLKPIELLTTR